jgi:DUF971 family protein
MKHILIRRIIQKDRTQFTIEWTDGKIADYRLSDLQRQCFCARCRDERTGKILIDRASVDDEVEAIRIVSVGRYALRIEFTSGCSQGIYTYSFLWGSLKEAPLQTEGR